MIRHRIAISAALLAAMFSLAGCVNIDAASASKVKTSMSYPLVFDLSVEAEGITKTTDDAGRVTRTAKKVDRKLTILGFTSGAEYEDVALTTTSEGKDDKK